MRDHKQILNCVKYNLEILKNWCNRGFWMLATAALASLLCAGSAEARLNLSQNKESFKLSTPGAGAFREYLATEPGPNHLIPSDVTRALTSDLPARLRDSCAEAVDGWRTGAGPTAGITLRLLTRDAGGVWLALRCSSSRRDIAQYYDERLLFVRPDTATGELMPFDLDAENDSTLYHIEFQEELLSIAGPAAAFRVSSSNDNPCCDGPTRFSEEKLLILAGTGASVKQLFTTKLRQDQDNHDDIDGDSHVIYVATVTFERDDRKQLETIDVKFNEEENGKARRSGIDRYGWDAEAGKYVEKE
ncbi:MAG: hypothetical protein ACREQF_02155 [Candidatus Binataceae bacterium]